MSNLIDLKAKELLPEIKKLHDSGYVNLNMCGSFEHVENEIKSNRIILNKFDFTDIRELYASLQRTFNH